MRGPAAGILIGAGALVLVALVFLQRSIGDSEPEPIEPPRKPSAAEPVSATPSSAPATPPTPAERISKLAPRIPVRGAEPTRPDTPPVLEAEPAEPTGKAPRIASLVQIRVQISAVEHKINECLASASARGRRSGTAMLMFIVAGKDKEAKTVVESPSIEHDETTLDDAQLVECMRDTALAMHFEYAQGSQPVAAKRKVVIENGKLVSDELVESRRVRH